MTETANGHHEGRSESGARRPVITIVGLGWLGSALGLSLQRVKSGFEIVGHDREPERAKAALQSGAIDRADWNLFGAAEAGDLVFLTEPEPEARATLAQIADQVRPGTLITDTAPVKARILREAAGCVPEGVSFIGGHPVVAPPEPGAEDLEGEAAAHSVFEGATYCLTPLPSASDDAMRVLGNLVASIGAKAFFIDPEEHDALVAGSRILPFLSALAHLKLLDGNPSASDLERLAGPALMDALSVSDEDLPAYRASAVELAPSLGRWLDQSMAELAALKATLESGEDALHEWLDAALISRDRWRFPSDEALQERGRAFDDAVDQSSMRRMLLGNLGRRRDEDEEPPEAGAR